MRRCLQAYTSFIVYMKVLCVTVTEIVIPAKPEGWSFQIELDA